MTKLDLKNLKGKEILLWAILLLNLSAFIANAIVGNLFFVFFNGAAVAFMAYTINQYYKYER
jgi:hypothetical protein